MRKFSVADFAFPLACLMPLLLFGRATAGIGMVLIALCSLVCLKRILIRFREAPDVAFALALSVWVGLSGLLHPPYGAPLFISAAWARFPLAYAGLRLWALRGERRLNTVAVCGCLAIAVVIADTYWQYFTGTSLSGRAMIGERLSGPLTHPNIGNLLLKLGVACAFALLASRQEGRARKSALVSVAAMLTALALLVPLTGERSISVLMILGAGVFTATILSTRPALWRRVIAGVCIVACLSLAAWSQDIVRARAELLILQIAVFPETVYGQLFKAAWMLTSSAPLSGVGAGRFYDECRPLELAGTLTYCDIHAHNTYLQFFSETGVPGAALFIAFAAACAARWWRTRNADALVFAGTGAALTILLFPVIVTQSAFANWPASLFWFTLAVTMSAVESNRKENTA